MFSHYVWLWLPDGTNLVDDLSDFTTLDCVLSEMNIGTLTLTLPPTHDYSRFRRDARIAYYRSPPRSLSNGIPRFVGGTTWPLVGRKRRIEQTGDGGWRETVTIKAVHPNHFLARRVVAYDETTSQADKTAVADNSIKAYVNENFVSATDSARNWASSLFTVDANLSAAPSIAKTASYRTVLNVCQELAAAATASGTYTGFEIIGTEFGAFRLRTYTGQRGANRSSTSGQPLVISVTRGAFGEVELEEDWTNLANAIYAGGGGRGDERVTTFVSDTASIAESPYGWSEWFQQVGGTTDATVLNDAAMQALREHRARILFTGSVKDTDQATFGEEYDWGDRVVGEYARPDPLGAGFVDTQQFDCRVDPVHIHVERSEDPETGKQTETETLDIRLRSES
jgi:ReqiPepy6 Gp37-like protein